MTLSKTKKTAIVAAAVVVVAGVAYALITKELFSPLKLRGVAMPTALHPVLDSTYRYTIQSRTELIQTIQDNKVRSVNAVDMDLSDSVAASVPGCYRFFIRYDRFDITAQAGDVNVNANAKDAATASDPNERMFHAFDGASIQATVDTTGWVLGITGLDSIYQQMYFLAKDNLSARAMLENSVKKSLNAQFFRQLFEKSWRILPDSSVKMGATWERSDTLSGDFPCPMHTTYTLDEAGPGLLSVKVLAKMEVKDQPVPVKQYQAYLSLDGEQTGEFRMNAQTRMIIGGQTRLKATGTVDVMGRSVPLEINSTYSIDRL